MNTTMAMRATNAVAPITMPAIAPADMLGVDEELAEATGVGVAVGSEVFDRNRERTSALVHCTDELDCLKNGN
jgi:hypothetical protein